MHEPARDERLAQVGMKRGALRRRERFDSLDSRGTFASLPSSARQAAATAAALSVPERDTRFAKKMLEVQRKQKGKTARAAKPSVEGRTITLLN